MNPLPNPAPWRRRLIIVTALALGALLSVTFHTGPLGQAAQAQAPAVVVEPRAAPAPAAVPDIEALQRAADDAAEAAADAKRAAEKARRDGRHTTVGVTVDDGRGTVHLSGFGTDRDYESFQDFAESAPWLAGLVFLSVSLMFLVPLAVIGLIIWYKMRKNRMLNETMVKLAERGVMPPAEAMAALGAETPPQAASPAAGSLYAQARAIRDNRQWSDLRKGVIMAAIGFALQAYSMFDSAEPNGFGLVLLFLGCGYIVLWYIEDRRNPQPSRNGPGI